MGVQRRIYAIGLVLAILLPSLALAQDKQAPSGSSQFAGQLATALAQVMQERDAALAQIDELKKELDAVKHPLSEPKK